MTTQTKSAELRFIPITKPGVVAFNFKHARTDAQEAAVRRRAAERGLLAGRAIRTRPDDQISAIIDRLKGR
jgi:hypothetical protein